MTRDEILATRTATWTDDARRQMAGIVEALRPSPRHLADILDWLEDLGARDGVSLTAVLGEPKLRAALASPGSAPDRLKRWKEALRRLRYPRLAQREQEFVAAVRALELGRGVAIAPPTGFEGGIVSVTIHAASAAELEAILDRLNDCRRAGDLAGLFALLA